MHVHSFYSDGLYSPADLARKIYRRSLEGFALTDHDTMDGIEPARKAAENWGLFFLPGCEFSTRYEPIGELHVLAYFPDGEYQYMMEEMERYQVARMERARKIAGKLKESNINFDFDRFINRLEKEGNNRSVGRMHIARELVHQGFFKTPQMAFDLYLGRGKPGYVDKDVPETTEFMRRLTSRKVICGLAHPDFLYDESKWEHLDVFERAGMNALEYRHPRIYAKLSAKFEERLADRFYLISGSDFHGDKKHRALGKYGIGIKTLKEMLNNFSNPEK